MCGGGGVEGVIVCVCVCVCVCDHFSSTVNCSAYTHTLHPLSTVCTAYWAGGREEGGGEGGVASCFKLSATCASH